MLTTKNRLVGIPVKAQRASLRDQQKAPFSPWAQRVLTSLFCLGFLAALLGCRPPGVSALFSGAKLIEKGQYAEAVPDLERATAILPTNAPAWNYLGLAYHYTGRSLDAEKAYRRALSLDHDLTEAHYNLGCLFLEQNRLEAAKGELLAYTLRRPNNVEGFVKLGSVQLRSREFANVEKTFLEALHVEGNNSEALNGLGLARLHRGRLSDAQQSFAAALKSSPQYVPALLNSAITAHMYTRDKALALERYKQYLALNPPPATAEAIRVHIRQLEGDGAAGNGPAPAPRPPAAPLTNAAAPATSTPTHAPTNGLAAVAPLPTNTVRSDRNAVTATKTQAVATARPALHPPAQNNLTPGPPTPVELVHVPPEAEVKVAQDSHSSTVGNPPMPPASSEKVADKKKTNGILQRLNPISLFRNEGKTEDKEKVDSTKASNATGVADTAYVGPRYQYKNPSRPSTGNHAEAERAFAQGVQAHEAHRLAQAVQSYRRAITLDPAYYEAQYNLGLAASEAGNFQQGLVAYEYALAIKPDSADARYNFALLLKQGGFFADAAAELEKLVGLRPEEARGHLALGNLYAQQLRDPKRARTHYLRVLDIDPHNVQAGAIRYWLADNPG